MHRLRLLSLAMLAVLAAASPALAGFTGTDVFLPSVGAKPGVAPAVWYTTVWVHNPNTTSANVTFYLLERQANLAPKSYTDTVPAGDTKRYDNAVKTMFAVETFGAIRVTANVKVLAGARIYSQSGTLDDSVGQYFAGLPAAFAIGNGQSTELTGVWQTQPAADSPFRFNFGFVETTGTGTCQVKVTAKDPTGAPLGNKTYSLRQWEQMQKSFASEFPSLSTDNARLTVEVTSGSGRVIAFGSSVANGSQDPATVEMAFRDELLGGGSGGLAEVTHDGTLTGAGTVASPLGLANNGVSTIKLADGAVTTAKIAEGAVSSEKITDNTIKTADLSSGAVTADKLANAAVTSGRIADGAIQTSHFGTKVVTQSVLAATGGATSGKVLGTDGSNLVWQTAGSGLTLPWAGSASADWAFRVDNTSATGRAAIFGYTEHSSVASVRGENNATTGEAYGLLGMTRSTTGTGILGQNSATSGKAIGVRGQSLSAEGIGVQGLGMASGGGTGVQGEAQFPTGIGVKGLAYNASGIGGYFSGGRGLVATSNGTGLARVALEATSQSSSGVSFYAHQGSNDAVIVGANTGSGELMKLFSGAGGANLRLQVANNGEIHGAGTGDLLRLTSGTVTSGNLRLKVTNDGNIGIDGNLFTGGVDVAEAFAVEGAVRDYEPGDVLVISAASDVHVEKSAEAACTRLAGVVATKPGIVLSRRGTDEDMSEAVPMGVIGVIPTKVTDEGGPIRRGDLLVTSSTPGHAMKAKPVIVQGVAIYPAGAVLGKALQEFEGPGTGLIEVLVNVK